MKRLQTAHALCSQRRRGGIRSVSAGRARMRKKNSIINMIVGLVGQLLNMLLSFGGRMVFVHYLSQEYLGVNGLFGDVLGMLNLAELGIGSAMIFSMYRPAAQNDERQLARLMNLYRTLYRIVAVVVLGIGLIFMPFLPNIIKGGEGIENLQLIYLLYLLQSATSYLLSYKNSIYLAYQKAYIRKALDQIIGIVRLILQIVVLVTTRNFILYLIIQLFMPMLTSAIIWARVDREFPYLKQYKELPEPQERKAIFKNVGALSLHKLATVIVRGTDNLIMSAFDGLATVGIYSNYKGELYEQLAEQVIDEHLLDSVQLLGFRDNPYPYMAAADLYVCPSYVEGFSTVVSEAVVLETPVVTTDCSGMREILGDSEYGLITRNTEESLFEGLRTMLDKPEVYQYYQQRVRERAPFFYMEERLKAYEEILDQ